MKLRAFQLGPKTAVAIAFASLLWISEATTSCGLFGSKGDQAALVQKTEAIAFAGAVGALEVLDAREAEHLRSIDKATPEQLAKERKTVERLKRARDALALVREILSGDSNGDEREQLRAAVEAMELSAEEIRANGVDVPQSALDGLHAARAFVGGK